MKYNMNRKPVYETPETELIIVRAENNFLQTGVNVTMGNPWENAEEVEL